MKKPHILLLSIFASVFFFSCEEESNNAVVNSSEEHEIEFELSFASRGDDDSDNLPEDNLGYELEDYADYFKEGESCLLISQRSTNLNLNFTENNSNCYKYVYSANDNADWENGYNFKSVNALSWEKILLNGQLGNGYAFGALFFPRDYTYQEEVEADQSQYDALLESDILGAWHRTSTIGDRLKFQLNHLMCKLKINLYIPVYKEELNNGIDVDKVIATAMAFRRDYSIEWGDRSTESKPVATPLSTIDGIVSDILMYNSVDGEPCILTNLKNFGEDDLESDDVKLYSFEMLFPKQTVSGDFLRFNLKRGDVDNVYVFNSVNLTNNANNFTFIAGTVSNLELYLPRTDNRLVLLKATLHDWNDAERDMTLTEE